MKPETIQNTVNLVTPLLFVIIGVIANRLGRNDRDKTPMVNYFAVGTVLMLMILASILTEIKVSDDGEVLVPYGWVIGMLFITLVSIDIDRYSSWIRDENGNPTDKKHLIRGVIGPNLFGVVAFAVYKFNS